METTGSSKEFNFLYKYNRNSLSVHRKVIIMSEIYKVIQGQVFPIRVYSSNSILIMRDDQSILSFNKVTEDNEGNLWLNILIDQTNFMEAGTKQFQLFENNQLKQSGVIQVIASLLVNADQKLKSKYQLIVEAIEKQLAGIATLAQKVTKVNDKQIQKYSAAQLLSLLDYFKGKLKEEEGLTEGVNSATDQMKIKYVFKIR